MMRRADVIAGDVYRDMPVDAGKHNIFWFWYMRRFDDALWAIIDKNKEITDELS